jgi:HPt (histidine-containing phosphotransfer) domain-containing protein
MLEPTMGEGVANELPIDMDAFRQDMKDQDLEDLIDDLIEAFVGDASSRFDALQAAVESVDANGILTAAHAYKSAAATMQAVRLADLLQQTETAAHDGDVTKAVELLPLLKTEHEAVLAQLGQA